MTTGALLDVIDALACIGTAVVLHPVVRLRSQLLSLGFLASRILEAVIIMGGVMALLGVVAVRDWSFLFGPGLAIGNALLLASNAATMFGINEPFSVLSPATQGRSDEGGRPGPQPGRPDGRRHPKLRQSAHERKVSVMIGAHELTRRHGDKTAADNSSSSVSPGAAAGLHAHRLRDRASASTLPVTQRFSWAARLT